MVRLSGFCGFKIFANLQMISKAVVDLIKSAKVNEIRQTG